MCWGCVVYDSAPTDYHRAVALMCLMGLRAREVQHVSPAWLAVASNNFLFVPPECSCDCKGCRRKARTGRKAWENNNMMMSRIIDFHLLGEDGKFLGRYINSRSTIFAQTTTRLQNTLDTMGADWKSLQYWGPIFLDHRFGLDTQTICCWQGKMSGLMVVGKHLYDLPTVQKDKCKALHILLSDG